MITIVTSFKPFGSDDSLRQLIAVENWREVFPDCEIGCLNPIQEIQPLKDMVTPIPGTSFFEDNGKNARLNDAIEWANLNARYSVCMYVNGDIAFSERAALEISRRTPEGYTLIGQRIDIAPAHYLMAKGEGGEARLNMNGKLHGIGGIDFFSFMKGDAPLLPNLYVGANYWDNVAVFFMRKERRNLMDITRYCPVYHLDHPVPLLPDGESPLAISPAAMSNRRNIREPIELLYTTDAQFYITSSGSVRSSWFSLSRVWRMVLTFGILKFESTRIRWVFRFIASCVRRACSSATLVSRRT